MTTPEKRSPAQHTTAADRALTQSATVNLPPTHKISNRSVIDSGSVFDNHDDVLGQLHNAGLLVGDILDGLGRVIHCRTQDDRAGERSGWYCLHELRLQSGKHVLVGAFGNWKEGVNDVGRPVSHRIELSQTKQNEAERKSIAKRVAAARRHAENLRKQQAQRAATEARKIWERLSLEGQCQYLAKKGIQPHGARFSPSGNLAIPIHDAMGRMHGIQIIYGDPKEKSRRGRDKSFWPIGMNKRGHFFMIGAPAWLFLIAEGFATAASLREATGYTVVVAFDCGNLQPVAEAIRKRYPSSKILICADDDFKTSGNPGVSAASLAALAVSGAYVAPSFVDRGERKLTVSTTSQRCRARRRYARKSRPSLPSCTGLIQRTFRRLSTVQGSSTFRWTQYSIASR